MKYLSNTIKIGLSLFSLCLSSGEASAFPELIRSGYQSCKACHHAPNGGGALNDYGRTIAGEHLSTWGTAERGETLYGLANFHPFELAGDVRYLTHHFDDERVTINQRFLMQKEVSLVFKPSPNVTFLASGGMYGFEPKEVEYRRYFARVDLGNLWLRVGRFLPAYGYDIADHTKGIKELFGQGKESFNTEAGYTTKYGELIVTRILGSASKITADKRPTVTQADSPDGYAGKANLFVTKGIQLGVSLASLEDSEKLRKYVGYHAFAGNERLYSLVEYQSLPDAAHRLYSEVGVQLFKGFHLKAELDAREQFKEVFGTIQWFPYPHFELSGSVSDRQYFMVSHYYL